MSGSGTAVPDQNFDFNTGYTYEDPGIKFDMYGDIDSYPIPGPEVWNAAGGGSGTEAGAGGNKTASGEEATSTPVNTRRALRFARRV